MAGTKAEPELRRISIATVRSRSEADAIMRRLKRAGIECFSVQERSAGAALSSRKHFAAIKVQVRSNDVARAIQQMQAKDGQPLTDSVSAAAKPVVSGTEARESTAARLYIPAGILLMIGAGLALLFLL